MREVELKYLGFVPMKPNEELDPKMVASIEQKFMAQIERAFLLPPELLESHESSTHQAARTVREQIKNTDLVDALRDLFQRYDDIQKMVYLKQRFLSLIERHVGLTPVEVGQIDFILTKHEGKQTLEALIENNLSSNWHVIKISLLGAYYQWEETRR